jgi:hypothetical protein
MPTASCVWGRRSNFLWSCWRAVRADELTGSRVSRPRSSRAKGGACGGGLIRNSAGEGAQQGWRRAGRCQAATARVRSWWHTGNTRCRGPPDPTSHATSPDHPPTPCRPVHPSAHLPNAGTQAVPGLPARIHLARRLRPEGRGAVGKGRRRWAATGRHLWPAALALRVLAPPRPLDPASSHACVCAAATEHSEQLGGSFMWGPGLLTWITTGMGRYT